MANAPIVFVRHGTTEWSFDALGLGVLDLPLNVKGISEVEATAQKLKEIQNAIIISSPKSRTLQTAAIIKKVINTEVQIEMDLDARYYGDFSQEKEACQKFQTALKDPNVVEDQLEFLLPKDAERLDLFDLRVMRIFQKIMIDFPEKSIIIVSHGEVYRSLCRSLMNDKRQYIAKGDIRLLYPPTSLLNQWQIKSSL